MYALYEFLDNLIIFQFVTEIIGVTIGAGLCYGALKWNRGLMTGTAIGWGVFLGLTIGMVFAEAGVGGLETLLLSAIIGAIFLPILTYSVPGVNRFVLGFIFGTKFIGMLTTVLAKEGAIGVEMALAMPFVCGAILGFCLMCWTTMRVLPFILCCTFIGAADIAPTISEWYNRLMYGFTGDPSILFDPIDLTFAIVFKIELTDMVTFVSMCILLVSGCVKQLKKLEAEGIEYSTPLIGFEVDRSENGKIYKE